MAKCYDCGLPYEEFGVDLVLPDQQWKIISPDGEGNGLLCANCIAKRVEKLGKGVILSWIK